MYDTWTIRSRTLLSRMFHPHTYVISQRFYVPVHFISEVQGPYSGLGLVKLNAQPIHELVEFCWLCLTISRVRLG
jgi:hypothetical protein